MDNLCKFKIGQRVAVRSQVELCEIESVKHAKPDLMVVIERRVIECYSNSQVTYILMVSNVHYGQVSTKVNFGPVTEPELVEYPEKFLSNEAGVYTSQKN